MTAFKRESMDENDSDHKGDRTSTAAILVMRVGEAARGRSRAHSIPFEDLGSLKGGLPS